MNIENIICIKEDYYKLFLSGKKKTTIRSGLRDIKLGQCYLRTEYDDWDAVITGFKYSKFCELTEKDAKLDGFDSLNELKSVLLEIYSSIELTQDVTIIDIVV